MVRKGWLEILSLCGFILAFTFLIIANFVQSGELCVIYLTIMSIAAILYFVSDFSKKIGMFFFFVTFFTFLISGAILPFYLGRVDWHGVFLIEEYIIACNIIYVSIVSLIIGYIFSSKYKIVWDGKPMSIEEISVVKNSRYNLERIQKITFLIFCVSSFISIYYYSQRMIYSLLNGYVSIYSEYSVPAIGKRMLIISRACFFIGLASKPDKKRVLYYLILGSVVPIIGFIAGGRGAAITFLIFTIFYLFLYREKGQEIIDKKVEKRRIKKFFVILVVLAIILLPFLYSYGYTRVNRNYEEASNVFDAIMKFFLGQGSSFNMIGYAVHYDGKLPGICYSFGTIIDAILGNNYKAFTVDAAIKRNSFGTMITYLVKNYNYLNLNDGMGSSYIAELYYDFGYIGVIISNIIIGMFLQFLTNHKTKSIILNSIVYLFFYYSLTMPRGPFLEPFLQMFSLSTVIIFFVVFFYSYKRKTK